MGRNGLPYTIGKRPSTVRLYRRPGRRNLYLRVWDPTARDGRGDWRKRSLGHDDVERGKAQAAELHAKLAAGEEAVRTGKATLRRLFSLYHRHRTPQKGRQEREADVRRIELWTRHLGSEKNPHAIRRSEWDRFVELRSTGEIDARGRPAGHPEHEGRGPVGPRTVERDQRFLLAVLNWGADWRTPEGYLLRENVCRGYPVEKEKNPSRPIATDERVARIRAVASGVTMDATWGGGRRAVGSHLPAIFDLAVETGRRLSSILALRHADLLPDRGPHGAIRWRAESDKQGRETVVPISPRARRALDRHAASMRELGLRGIGDAPLFPAPEDPSTPLDRHMADRWLRKAERLAGVEPHQGSAWHAYRRRWATVRKHLPATDVAAAGGWQGPETLQRVYQQADPETMYEVVTGGGSLREVEA